MERESGGAAHVYRDAEVKRFRYHLRQRFSHPTEATLDTLVTAWVTFTDYDLERVQR
jgi:hypothetical protein